eukprot:632721-Rhodomonas_salina.3
MQACAERSDRRHATCGTRRAVSFSCDSNLSAREAGREEERVDGVLREERSVHPQASRPQPVQHFPSLLPPAPSSECCRKLPRHGIARHCFLFVVKVMLEPGKVHCRLGRE